MNCFNAIKKIIKNPKMVFVYMDQIGIIRLKDEKYLKILYKTLIGKELDLNNPKTYLGLLLCFLQNLHIHKVRYWY